MTTNRDVFKARQAIARRLGQLSAATFYAQVSAVDSEARTCTVVVDDAPYTDVLLAAVENKEAKGCVLFPKVDSTVLVSRIGGSNELYVAMFSQIDRVEIDAEQIVFNGGDNKGMVKIEELKKNLDALKEYVESINAVLPSAFSAVGAAIASSGAAGATAYQTAMAGKVIVIEDMENTKIKH